MQSEGQNNWSFSYTFQIRERSSQGTRSTGNIYEGLVFYTSGQYPGRFMNDSFAIRFFLPVQRRTQTMVSASLNRRIHCSRYQYLHGKRYVSFDPVLGDPAAVL